MPPQYQPVKSLHASSLRTRRLSPGKQSSYFTQEKPVSLGTGFDVKTLNFVGSFGQRTNVVQIQFTSCTPALFSFGNLRPEFFIQTVGFAFKLLRGVSLRQGFHRGASLVIIVFEFLLEVRIDALCIDRITLNRGA